MMAWRFAVNSRLRDQRAYGKGRRNQRIIFFNQILRVCPGAIGSLVPRAASSKEPFLLWMALVKAPFTWPNSVDSSRSVGSEPLFTGTNRRSERGELVWIDRKSTRLNSSHLVISYAVFCLKKKTK